MFIYLIVNHVTGKYYVGQHKGKNLKHYFQVKLGDAKAGRSRGSYLYNSMRKHGANAFSVHALLSDIQTSEELNRSEKEFIQFLRARDPDYGYNIALGGQGGGMLGHKQSPQTIEKIKKSLAGKQCYPRTPKNELKRKAACQVSVQTRIASGSYFSQDSVDKIKQARADQDESYRAACLQASEAADPNRRLRAAATHRGKKHKMSSNTSAAIKEAVRRSSHKRWHVSRGITEFTCSFCAEQES